MPSQENLTGALEALLFVADEPVTSRQLASASGHKTVEVEVALDDLRSKLEERDAGIQLREVAGGWRLYTHPAYHDLIEKFVISWDTRTLSQAALEVLSVIAYYQPASKSTVSSIRGVNSDSVIASLMDKDLVRESGRENGSNGAILYGTTTTFLEKFGLRSTKDLPPLEDFAPDEKSKQFIRQRLSTHIQSTEELDMPEQTDEDDEIVLEDIMDEVAVDKAF
jgi:segregation and condensation protein B